MSTLIGGDTTKGELESEGTLDTGYAIKQTLCGGAYMIQIESEGITENANPWQTEVPAELINEIGLDKLMFEAAQMRAGGAYAHAGIAVGEMEQIDDNS